ncbi:MAG TPA: hypothetical protein VF897_18905 [Roseiflexaceae bacterium]
MTRVLLRPYMLVALALTLTLSLALATSQAGAAARARAADRPASRCSWRCWGPRSCGYAPISSSSALRWVG